MRRGSVVGPLILIVLGVLFMANNVRPDISVMRIISRSWPFILIGWGLLRIVELLYLSSRRKPLPVAGVSGGEWTLIVLLGVIGSGMFFAEQSRGWSGPLNMRLRGLEVFGESYDYPIEERKVPVARNVRVVVEHGRGNVRITGSDLSEVTVTGRKTVRALRREDAESANNRTSVEVIAREGSLLVRSNSDRSENERFLSTDLEIAVPRGATVETHGRHGDFDITDIQGNVSVESDNAGVRLQNIGGSVVVEVRRSDMVRAADVKGEVELKGRGDDVELENISGQVAVTGYFSGNVMFRKLAKPLRMEETGRGRLAVRLESLPGELHVSRGDVSGENLTGPLFIEARSKDVRISDFTEGVTIAVDRGDIELRPGKLPLSRTSLATKNGHIDVALPEGAKFSLTGTAEVGEISNDYGDELRVSEEGRRSTISGSVGSGPQMTLSTERGSMTIRRGSSEPRPPTPPEPPKVEI